MEELSEQDRKALSFRSPKELLNFVTAVGRAQLPEGMQDQTEEGEEVQEIGEEPQQAHPDEQEIEPTPIVVGTEEEIPDEQQEPIV